MNTARYLRGVTPLSEVFLRAAGVDAPHDEHDLESPEPPEPAPGVARMMSEAIAARCRAIIARRQQLFFAPSLSDLLPPARLAAT